MGKKGKKFGFIYMAMLSLSLFCVGCENKNSTSDTLTGTEGEKEQSSTKEGTINSYGLYEKIGNMPISDNDSLYELDNDNEIVTMYLTVQTGSESDGCNHTWKEVNQNSAYYYEELGIDRYAVDGILKVGNEHGPVVGEFGYEDLTPNATVTIRGQTSTRRAQKNYKISIRDGKGSYKEEKVINLNKHVGDSLRFRNKLCYDLMEELPDMMSARTQFVHLYVKDLTASGNSGDYEDYGLYTQVEQINKTYLKNHGLDKNGQLYKVNFFEFYRYEDRIMESTNPDYDSTKFEEYLEIKGNEDHSKLIRMLEELNDDAIPIEQTFSKWFDEENVFSWLAFQILVGNKDTQSRNLFLYSPLNVDKWYFISWDNDGAFLEKERELLEWKGGQEWETGVSNYWGNLLFRKILKSEEYQEKLDQKIEEYKKFLSEERLNAMAEEYEAIIGDYVRKEPDITYLPTTLEEREKIIAQFAKEVGHNYEAYKESYQKPQPFFIGVPELQEDGLHIMWDLSYDFEHRNISYTVELSEDASFQNKVYEKDEIQSYSITIPEHLKAGKYFLRVKAKNEDGFEQYAFDIYQGENGAEYGVKCFYVTEDGEILEDVYVE